MQYSAFQANDVTEIRFKSETENAHCNLLRLLYVIERRLKQVCNHFVTNFNYVLLKEKKFSIVLLRVSFLNKDIKYVNGKKSSMPMLMK